MTQITDHLAEIRDRIAKAATAVGRSADDVMLLAVSKQQSIDAIKEAWQAGQRPFAESFVQEALNKMRHLEHLNIEWHFIGRVQANKTRAIAEHFRWVHTIDRAKIATRLNAHRPEHAPALNVLIQVNQGGESQKAGVAVTGLRELAELVATQPRLLLRGLMTIPPNTASDAQKARHFEGLRNLAEELSRQGIEMDVLSMGMSADFELAIRHGSSCVRVGTALFGHRKVS